MDAAGIVEFIKANWMDIVFAYTSLVTIASIVVKFTPTKKDNEILEKITSFVGKWIALNKVDKSGK
jgi:hypothetical protein